MKEETTLLQDLKRMVLSPLKDFPKFFTSEFYKENWDKHFWRSFLIMIPIMTLLVIYTDIHETNFYFAGKMWQTGYIFSLSASYAIAFGGNWLREWWYATKEVPFSWEDCRFGGYGGVLAEILIIILILIL